MKTYKFTNYKNSYGDIKYSIGNTVNNIVITRYSIRWALDFMGESLHRIDDS